MDAQLARHITSPMSLMSSPDDRPSFQESLARLHFLAEEQGKMGLVLGDAGSGKSRLLHRFAQECQGGQVALLHPAPTWNYRQTLWNLAESLRTRPCDHDEVAVLWWRIVDRIAENAHQNLGTVLLCDDVVHTEFGSLEIWHKLLDACRSTRTGRGPVIVLALPERQLPWLGQDLLERCDLRIELEPADTVEAREIPVPTPGAAERSSSPADLSGSFGFALETASDLAHGLS